MVNAFPYPYPYYYCPGNLWNFVPLTGVVWCVVRMLRTLCPAHPTRTRAHLPSAQLTAVTVAPSSPNSFFCAPAPIHSLQTLYPGVFFAFIE